MSVTGIMLLAAGAAAIAALFYRSRRYPNPCPARLSVLLENPLMERWAGSRMLLDRAGVAPGMWVLDVGCGPGRLSLPAAERVGQQGQVVALDVQEAMLRKLDARIAEHGVTNIRTVHAGAGEGRVEPEAFDRAFLVTVLGEIRERVRALTEIYDALRPGGILSITEVLVDPDYQSRRTVRRLAKQVGFEQESEFGGVIAFTLNFRKPGARRREV